MKLFALLLTTLSSLALSAVPDDGNFTIYKSDNPVPKYGLTDDFLNLEFLGGDLVKKFIISGNDQLISSACDSEYLLDAPTERKSVWALLPFSGSINNGDGHFTIYRDVLVSDDGAFLGLVPGSRDAYLGTINFSDPETAEMQIFSIFTYFTGFDTGIEFCLIEDNYELRKET